MVIDLKDYSRRDFLKTGASAVAGLSLAALATSCASTKPAPGHVKGTERLRIGLVGAGGRGTGAVLDCLEADPSVVVVALGDLYSDRLDTALKALKEKHPDRIQVTPETMFTGFDCYKGVVACDIDLVLLAAPPGFRPLHFQAAVEAGKHVFMEKPVGVDPVGVRSVIASAELAAQKRLSVVAGTQRRHDPAYRETIRRIHDGAIGELVGGQAYWTMGGLWVYERQPGQSDMEWQTRNWLYFDWLSGDHICEQHIHNIDVMNWAFGTPPVKAVGVGGRQARTDPKFGNIFDHFSIEFEYPNGARIQSTCAQIEGSTFNRVSERLVGSKGTSNPFGEISGKKAFKFESPGEPVSPYILEHVNLINSIKNGEALNEGKQVALSNMTAILGRMCAYTGREISFDWALKSSKLDLSPPAYTFGDLPVRPVPIPGQTDLI